MNRIKQPLSRLTSLALIGSALALSGLVIADGNKAIEPPENSLSEQQAIDIAQQQVAGQVQETELEQEGQQWVWEVEINDQAQQKWEIKIDAQTGDVLEKEQDD